MSTEEHVERLIRGQIARGAQLQSRKVTSEASLRDLGQDIRDWNAQTSALIRDIAPGVELGIRSVAETRRPASMTLAARTARAFELLSDSLQRLRGLLSSGLTFIPERDMSLVYLVYGRNERAKVATKSLLYAWGMKPADFPSAAVLLAEGAPNVFEVVFDVMHKAGAVLVLLTPDESHSPSKDLTVDEKAGLHRGLTARPNVWIEAGMALALDKPRAILMRFGATEIPTDLEGLARVEVNERAKYFRKRLAERLQAIGCSPKLNDDHWEQAGDFPYAPSI